MERREEMEVLLNRPLADEEEMKVGNHSGDLNKEYADETPSVAAISILSPAETTDMMMSSAESKEQMLESAKAEMGQMKQENKRLKSVLSQIIKDYESLQSQFAAISHQRMQHGHSHHRKEENRTNTVSAAEDDTMATNEEDNEAELLCLSLGTARNTRIGNTGSDSKDGEKKSNDGRSGELSLGLQCSSKLEGSASSDRTFDDDQMRKEEVGGGGRQRSPTPSKVSTKSPRVEDRELSPQVQVKKARVSVRARCDAPTMNDGCQWRKYGQKISKGNPCPRAYYRCTVAPSCPVRKQVQRCSADMSILVTTYEGTHNHPLPLAATNMASTTLAAASMLLSPSSSSSPLSTTNLNFALSQSSNQLSPFHHLSATPAHPPTITLDLTSPSPHFNTSSLDFSPYPSLASGFFNKYTNQLYNNNNSNNRALNVASYLMKNSSLQQDALTDTLAKAITSDPSFKSALAAAITSIVGNEGSVEAQVVPPTIPSGISYQSNSPSPVLAREKFGYLQSSSSLGLLNGKGSSDRDSLNL